MQRVWKLWGLVAVVGMLVASPSALAEGLPSSPVSLNGSLRIAPSEVTLSEDGNAFIVGPWSGTYRGWNHAPKRFPAINWTSWMTSAAVGTGAWVAGNCEPSCTQGTFRSYPVDLREWRPRIIRRRLIFTRLRVTYTGEPPAHSARSVTVVARYLPSGVWGWS